MIQMVAVRPFTLAGRRLPLRRGEPYEIDAPTARDHERRGLGKKPDGTKMEPAPSNKMAPPSENKRGNSQAGGEGARSSASPPAPASPKTTARPSRGGKAKKRKGA